MANSIWDVSVRFQWPACCHHSYIYFIYSILKLHIICTLHYVLVYLHTCIESCSLNELWIVAIPSSQIGMKWDSLFEALFYFSVPLWHHHHIPPRKIDFYRREVYFDPFPEHFSKSWFLRIILRHWKVKNNVTQTKGLDHVQVNCC